MTHRLGDPRLLGSGDQMVDQHAKPSARAGTEIPHDTGQIVDAAEVLDHHTFDTEVITPHLLDKFGVVAAFDIDPAGQCHPGLSVGHLHRSGRGACSSRTVAQGCSQDHRPTLKEKPGPQREHPVAPATVLQFDAAALDAHHGADES